MKTSILDYIRIGLYIALAMILFSLYQSWVKEHATVNAQPVESADQSSVTSKSDHYLADIAGTTPKTMETTSVEKLSSTSLQETASRFVDVDSDLFHAVIDTVGGNIVQLQLKQYPEKLHSPNPFVLLNNDPATRYVAQSGLLGATGTGPDTSSGQAKYSADQTHYVLAPDQKTLSVQLHWKNASGLFVTKTLNFERDSYEIHVEYSINNQSSAPWAGNLYSQLMRTNTPPATGKGFSNFTTYFGAAVSSPEKLFQKVPFKSFVNNPVNQMTTGGWVAMIQHYFVSAWIPDSNSTSHYFTHVTQDGLYAIGSVGPGLSVAPGQSLTTHATLYSGPAITERLEHAAPGLKLTIDYGWFWFISSIIFWMMQKIYNVVGNWGWSIVLVTVLIKLIFYPLSSKSYRSMSVMKQLQPRIALLKERYGDDKQKFTQATLELYRKEKINPMSGCLPILVQIPVFIGLYWVLVESVQLRHAPFMLWIHDLSVADPYYVLPVLMGLSMFLQQRLNPPPSDPTQAKVMLFMPIVFTVMFLNFPAGLMVYWVVNNTLSFFQQWVIMRSIEKNAKTHPFAHH